MFAVIDARHCPLVYLQDISVSEAEIRSKYETGVLNKVRLSAAPSFAMMILIRILQQLRVDQLKVRTGFSV